MSVRVRRGEAGPALTKLRHDLIRAELAQYGAVRIRDLINSLGVSRTTVRRDLYALIAAGEAINAHGGALLPAPPGRDALAEQEAIAVAAARTVADCSTVGLFGGPLVRMLARQLCHRGGLSVVTNSLSVARILGDDPPGRRPQVTLLSGSLRSSAAVHDSLAAAALAALRLDAAYFDCAGFDPRLGATVDDLDEADLRRVAVRVAERRILLLEKSRRGAAALGTFAAPSDLDIVIDARTRTASGGLRT